MCSVIPNVENILNTFILINSILAQIILVVDEMIVTKFIINLEIFSPHISLIQKLIHWQNFKIGWS